MTRDELLAARTATWPADTRTAIAVVVEALRPSGRHVTDILDWLDDLAARDGTQPGAALADAELHRVLGSGGSAPERLKRWKERLRRMRYPRLAAREEAIAAQLRAMAVGPAVAIATPPGLEGGVVTVTIRARSAPELDAALDRLRACIARGDVARLFALLDET